jgi:fructose-1,6-bisphosphatase/inositol monophosphatase family enzyme
MFSSHGEVSEWLKETVLKTVVPATVPRVRIPPSPPRKAAAIAAVFCLTVFLLYNLHIPQETGAAVDEQNFGSLFRSLARLIHEEHMDLGLRGKEDCGTNRFGDRQLRADEAAEREIVETFRSCGIRVRRISEELGRHTEPGAEYTLFIDGLDGSSVYKKTPWDDILEGRGRYATMFAIYSGTNPLYRDALVSCILEHPTRRLIIATEAECWVEHLDNPQLVEFARTSKAPLSTSSLIYCESEDPNWGQMLHTRVVHPLARAGYVTTPTGCTAGQYFDVATGVAAATVQWTRKDNLELAVARQIVEDAGGTMITLHGRHIADFGYDQFGHDPDDVQIVIAAANSQVAYELQCLLVSHS